MIGIILAVLLLLVTIQSTFFFLSVLKVGFLEWIFFNGEMKKIFLFVFLGCMAFSQGTPTFFDAVLAIKDQSILKVNVGLEEAEATLDKEKIVEIDGILKDFYQKEPNSFIYPYLLSRLYYNGWANFFEKEESNKEIKRHLVISLEYAKESIKLNKDFSDSYRIAGDIYMEG
ncbi:MAG: hypothetical protein AB1630_12830 [bacterium]